MKQCKYIITDEIGDKYCGNEKCPYTADWCEIHNEDNKCKYSEVENEDK